MFSNMKIARFAPFFVILTLTVPIAFGLFGTILPAFGNLPPLGGHGFTLNYFKELFATSGIYQSALISLTSGLVAGLISLSIVAAFVGGYSESRIFKTVRQLISPLLAVPHAAAAFGFAFMIAPSGFFMRIFSNLAMLFGFEGFDRPPDILIINDPYGIALIFGLVVKEIPFLFLVTLAAMPQIHLSETMRLARSMGFGDLAGFMYLAWPQIYRQIRLAVYAVIAYATSVVDMAAILGPHTPPTLPIQLLKWMNDPELTTRFLASAGAVLQLGVTVFALIIWFVLEKIGHHSLAMLRNSGFRMTMDSMLRRIALGAVSLSAFTVFGGIALLAIWSFSGLWQFPDLLPKQFSLRSWDRSLPRITDPLVTTLVLGLASTAIAVLMTILCLEREQQTGRDGGQRALAVIYLPLIVPQISFVFGLQICAIIWGIDAEFYTLVITHLIFVLPYVYLSLSDNWRALDKRYDVIAAGLGLNRLQTLLKVRIPLLTRAILAAFAVGFAVSIGQYLPTLLIGAGRITTITTEAVALSSGGNRRIIGVYAFLQILLPFLMFLIASAIPNLIFKHRRAMSV